MAQRQVQSDGPVREKPANRAAANAQNHGAPGKWSSGLLDCFSPLGTCCMATCCPCVLHGKTYARNHGDLDSNGINGQCCAYSSLMCIFCGSNILAGINRGSTREKYGIEGSNMGDICTACFCTAAQLVQEDNESIIRTTGMNPKTKQPYISPPQMTYP